MYCVRHFEGERTSTKIKYLHCPRLAESVLVAETAIRSNRLNRPQSLRMACTNPDRPPPSPHHHLLPNSIGIVPLTASRANIAVALSPFLIIHRHRVAIMPSLSVDLSSCRPSPSSCHHTAHRCPSPLCSCPSPSHSRRSLPSILVESPSSSPSSPSIAAESIAIGESGCCAVHCRPLPSTVHRRR